MENIKRIDEKRVEIDGQIYRLDEPCENVAEEKQSNRFKPSVGEVYYRIGGAGFCNCFTWDDDYYDNVEWEIGNCFRTEEEAKFMVEKLKVLAELSEFTESKDRPWDEKTEHWFFCWDTEHKNIEYSENTIYKYSYLYFESEEIVKRAVVTVGEDRIKKYLFGVEND